MVHCHNFESAVHTVGFRLVCRLRRHRRPDGFAEVRHCRNQAFQSIVTRTKPEVRRRDPRNLLLSCRCCSRRPSNSGMRINHHVVSFIGVLIGCILCLKANCSPFRSISVVSYGHSANNSQSPILWLSAQYEICMKGLRNAIIMSQAKMQVPAEFEQLRNKSMVFRINLKNEHIRNPAKPILVLSVIHNEELEAQYCSSMVDDQDELSRMVEEDADDLESDVIDFV
nr:uncharacterized protein LOC109156538 [Ipomoea trifida]